MKTMTLAMLGAAATLAVPFAQAAQLSNDGKAAIPKDVQQIIVVDYRAMQNSPAAMALKDRVLPPELKRLETALKTSGLKVDQDADTLAFAAFRSGDGTRIVGIAQGQFHTGTILNELRQGQDQGDAAAREPNLSAGLRWDERVLSESNDDGVWRSRGGEGFA